MLTELRIRNFAIIENLEVSFQGGMNVLTGETGAGKSVIIQAANLILGDRAASDLIRSGEKEAAVEAFFSIEGSSRTAESLSNLGIGCDDGVVIRRLISQEGKNRVFINGTLATLGMLTEIAEGLIGISSQHEHQILLKPNRHLHLLDSYGRLDAQTGKFRALFREYCRIKKELEEIESGEKDRAGRIELLAFQLEEIGKAEVKPDEDEALSAERSILANAEKLAGCASFGEEGLYSSEGSIVEKLGEIIARLKEGASFDAGLGGTAASLEGILFQLEDAALTLRDYGDRISINPSRLEAVEDRLAVLDRLKRKYGPALADVIRRSEDAAAELEALEGGKESRDETEKRLHDARKKVMALAAGLSKSRRKAAERLSLEMASELAELGMNGARFEAMLFRLQEVGDNGLDEAEFYLSTNPGEELRPLVKTASGGELSRIMLALKGLLLGEEKVPSLIFDEVDAGIGGGMAEVVGKKLKTVSRNTQVICITHLPQIASLADVHLRVSKDTEKGRTHTSIERLNETERVDEISRMLGGLEITEKTKAHAREMLAMREARYGTRDT